MNKIRDFKMKVDKKLLGAGIAVMSVVPSFAQESGEASSGPMASLDNLNTALGTLNTKAETIMIALGVLALTITIGIVVMKITKKGQRAG